MPIVSIGQRKKHSKYDWPSFFVSYTSLLTITSVVIMSSISNSITTFLNTLIFCSSRSLSESLFLRFHLRFHCVSHGHTSNVIFHNFRQPWRMSKSTFIEYSCSSAAILPGLEYCTYLFIKDDTCHHDSPWCGPSVLGGVWSIWWPAQQRPPSGANLGWSTWKNLQPSPHQGWRNPPCTNNNKR